MAGNRQVIDPNNPIGSAINLWASDGGDDDDGSQPLPVGTPGPVPAPTPTPAPSWAGIFDTGPKPASPSLSDLKFEVDEDGQVWVYDPSKQQRVKANDTIIPRVANGQLGVLNTRTGEWRPATGVPPKEPKELTPSQQATQRKLEHEEGDVIWSGPKPVSVVGPGGATVQLDPEGEAAQLVKSLTDLKTRRDELVRLSDPKFQTPGEGEGELASIQKDIAAIDSEARDKANYLVVMAKKNKLDLSPYASALGVSSGSGNFSGGGSAAGANRIPLSEKLAEIDYKNKSDLEYELKGLAEKVRLGYIELPDAKRQADLLRDQALEKTKNDYAKALATHNSQLKINEFNITEKPYKDADLAIRQEQSNLARQKAQVEALNTQAQAGQGIIKAGMDVGYTPSLETIQYAFSPLDTALRILNTPVQTEPVFSQQPPVSAPAPAEDAENGDLPKPRRDLAEY